MLTALLLAVDPRACFTWLAARRCDSMILAPVYLLYWRVSTNGSAVKLMFMELPDVAEGAAVTPELLVSRKAGKDQLTRDH